MSIQYSVAEDLKAVGTTINNALVLENGYDYYFIESSTPNSGVKIPFCQSGNQVTVVNHTANTILAYPQNTGNNINAQASGIPISLPAGVSIRFITSDGIQWHSLIDTAVPVTPVLTPNKVLGTDPSGNLIGIANYSTAGQISSVIITDVKGEINVSTINATDIKTSNVNTSNIITNTFGCNTSSINSINGGVINTLQLDAQNFITTPLLTSTNVTVSGTASCANVNTGSLITNNATIGGNAVVTGGVGCATCTCGTLTVSGNGTINALTSPNINTNHLQINSLFNQSVGFSQNVTANSWAGILKIGGFNLNGGQLSLPFTFNNSFITASNMVLMDVWLEFIGTTNEKPIFLRRTQSNGSIIFTVKNPGATPYAACVLVIQFVIFG